MTAISSTSDATFESDVLNADLPVLVDFGAEWCHPCKQLDPIVEELAAEWQGKVRIVKLDIDDNSELVVKYGVMGVPTLILFVDGSPVQRLSGYQPKDRIISKFGSYI